MSASETAVKRQWALTIPQGFILLLSVIPFVIFLRLAFTRIGFPFDLEWIEGHMLAMATRFARGLSIYPAPSLDYIPAPYFPFYFFVTGSLIKLFGPHFWVGRLVSILATLGTCSLIFSAVRKRTANDFIALACASIFIAAYGFTKAFYDLFRIDALAIFLLVLAFHVADPLGSMKRAVASGFVLGLAMLTKQNAMLFFPGLACVYLVRDWRKCAAMSAAFLLTIVPAILVYNAATHGWFVKYTFELVGGTPEEERFLLIHTWIFGQYAVALAVIALSMAARLTQNRVKDFFGDKWLAFFSIAYVVSFLFRLTGGGAGNALIPVCAAAAVGAGAMLPEALSLIRGEAVNRVETKGASALWVLVCLLLVQVISQGYWYDREMPSKRDYTAARSVLKDIDSLDGTYYMPGHVLPRDNTFWIHEMSWRDFENSKWGRPIMNRLAQEFRERRVEYVIDELNRGVPHQLRSILASDYEKVKTLQRVKMASATSSSPGTLYKHK